MTTEEKRIAIAEACGWTGIVMSAPSGIYELRGFSPGECSTQIVPNYPADLNAMHEAEKLFTKDSSLQLHRAFTKNLYSVIDKKHGGMLSEFEDDPVEIASILLQADASDHVDAFILTLGLQP